MYLRYVVCTCTLDQFLSLPPLLIAYTYMQSCTHTADGLHTRCFNLFFSWEAACFCQDQNTRRPCGYLPKSTMFDRSSHVLNAAATNLTYDSNVMRAASVYISLPNISKIHVYCIISKIDWSQLFNRALGKHTELPWKHTELNYSTSIWFQFQPCHFTPHSDRFHT